MIQIIATLSFQTSNDRREIRFLADVRVLVMPKSISHGLRSEYDRERRGHPKRAKLRLPCTRQHRFSWETFECSMTEVWKEVEGDSELFMHPSSLLSKLSETQVERIAITERSLEAKTNAFSHGATTFLSPSWRSDREALGGRWNSLSVRNNAGAAALSTVPSINEIRLPLIGNDSSQMPFRIDLNHVINPIGDGKIFLLLINEDRAFPSHSHICRHVNEEVS